VKINPNMLHEILAKLQRKSQISLLRKHPNVSVKGIKLGTSNHFILHEGLKRSVSEKELVSEIMFMFLYSRMPVWNLEITFS
jgi:hypothetical protein